MSRNFLSIICIEIFVTRNFKEHITVDNHTKKEHQIAKSALFHQIFLILSL